MNLIYDKRAVLCLCYNYQFIGDIFPITPVRLFLELISILEH